MESGRQTLLLTSDMHRNDFLHIIMVLQYVSLLVKPVYICNYNVKYHRFHSTLENITHQELDTVGNLMSNHRLRY